MVVHNLMQEKDCQMQMKQQQLLADSRNKTHPYISRSLWCNSNLHTDHCAKKLLSWIDGLLDASESISQKTEKLVFFSHD
jgi:hypothetical protein